MAGSVFSRCAGLSEPTPETERRSFRALETFSQFSGNALARTHMGWFLRGLVLLSGFKGTPNLEDRCATLRGMSDKDTAFSDVSHPKTRLGVPIGFHVGQGERKWLDVLYLHR